MQFGSQGKYANIKQLNNVQIIFLCDNDNQDHNHGPKITREIYQGLIHIIISIID